MVPFGDYQREIAMRVPPALRIVIYRRFMMRVAERIARREGAKALVTGESLGQVASQTLDNSCRDERFGEDADLPSAYRLRQARIIEDAKKLGTFEISSQDAPDCCTLFMPRAPRRTRSCAMYMTQKPICLSTSGPMKSWTRSRYTITVAPNRISARRRRKTSSPHSGRCVLPDGQ